MKEKLVMGIGIGCLLILAIPIGMLILLATLIWNGMDLLFRFWSRRSRFLIWSMEMCVANWKSKLLYGYEKTLSSLGGFQRTSKQQLYGMRLDGEDAYTGTYQADCRNVRGKDVVFGGCSIQTRTLWLTVTVGARNGIVEIYVLNGDKEKEYLTPNEQGMFSKIIQNQGGNCYVVVDYADYTGTVTLSSEYPT